MLVVVARIIAHNICREPHLQLRCENVHLNTPKQPSVRISYSPSALQLLLLLQLAVHAASLPVRSLPHPHHYRSTGGARDHDQRDAGRAAMQASYAAC